MLDLLSGLKVYSDSFVLTVVDSLTISTWRHEAPWRKRRGQAQRSVLQHGSAWVSASDVGVAASICDMEVQLLYQAIPVSIFFV